MTYHTNITTEQEIKERFKKSQGYLNKKGEADLCIVLTSCTYGEQEDEYECKTCLFSGELSLKLYKENKSKPFDAQRWKDQVELLILLEG